MSTFAAEEGPRIEGNYISRHVDVSAFLPSQGRQTIHCSIYLPSNNIEQRRCVLFCLPGGGLSARYFDLVAGNDQTHSFARAMTTKGFIVVAIDHLGTGLSSTPRDGLALLADDYARMNAYVCQQIGAALSLGDIDGQWQPLGKFVSVGVGHSMGGFMTIIQQAEHETHQALVLMGISNRGMPEILSDEERACVENPERIQQHIASLARQRFGAAYIDLDLPPYAAKASTESKASAQHAEALVDHRTPLIAITGLMSMIPGAIAHHSAALTVPIFLAAGDRDICGPLGAIAKEFPSCSELRRYELPGTGHNHFVYHTCRDFMADIGDWLRCQVEKLHPI